MFADKCLQPPLNKDVTLINQTHHVGLRINSQPFPAQDLLAINSLYNPERCGVCIGVQRWLQPGSAAVHPACEFVCTQGFESVLKVMCLWLSVEWARFHYEAIHHVAECWNMWWFPSHNQMLLNSYHTSKMQPFTCKSFCSVSFLAKAEFK